MKINHRDFLKKTASAAAALTEKLPPCLRAGPQRSNRKGSHRRSRPAPARSAHSDKLRQGIRFIGADGWIHADRGQPLEAGPKSILDSTIGPDEIRLYKNDDHLQNFIDRVFSRAQTVAPVEVAHRSISVAHLGTIAMKTGRKLFWDPDTERFNNDDEANRLLSRPMRSPWRL